MATFTANQFTIPSGAPSAGKQAGISFDGLQVDNTTKKITFNKGAVAGGDVEIMKETSGRVAFFDVSEGRLAIGDFTDPENPLHVKTLNEAKVPGLFEQTTTTSTVDLRNVIAMKQTTSLDMGAGFGVGWVARIEDVAAVSNNIGKIQFFRGTADNEGDFGIRCGTNGDEMMFKIDQNGKHTLNASNLDTQIVFAKKTSGSAIFFDLEFGQQVIGDETIASGASLTLGGGFARLALKETTSPGTPLAGHGYLLTKSDNKAYFITGDGVEHELAFV